MKNCYRFLSIAAISVVALSATAVAEGLTSYQTRDGLRGLPETLDAPLRATVRAYLAERLDRDDTGRLVPPSSAMRVDRLDRLLVDIVAEDDAEALADELAANHGCQTGDVFRNVISARCPIATLAAVGENRRVNFVRAAAAGKRVGVVTSQGDAALQADVARATFAVDGTGVTIGTLSDSYNCLGGANGDVASGDLPAGIVVLDEGPCPASDEGRGMMQLIHDLAPGASQAFHTALAGQASFAQGIIDLKDAGAQVINDDILYFAEPWFQDGIIAQAVDQVVAAGASYFSAAGNDGRDSYEETFRPSGQFEPLRNGQLHDFDPGAGVDVFQTIQFSPGDTSIVLQWSDRYRAASGAPGARSDYDLIVCPQEVLDVDACFYADARNLFRDPIELLDLSATGSPVAFLAISRVRGAINHRIKYIGYNAGLQPLEYDKASSTIVGHANAAGAQAVGAAAWFETPEFGQTPPLLESFSSGGGTAIFFDAAGTRIMPVVRPKPEIVAVDGTNTTFFGSDIAEDADAFPNFFGTSAAAPHAAAVAALLNEAAGGLSPADLYSALQDTAIDMATPGFDSDSGFGLIQADAALSSVMPFTVANPTP